MNQTQSFSFEELYLNKKNLFENYLKEYIDQRFSLFPQKAHKLKESILYSLKAGGKRFRPVLSLLTAEALKLPFEMILPFSLSVEMIHTYSLIHDDLPAMDNDDFRRGKPTNHKVFGEAMALLSGDALLTEAFFWLSQSYGKELIKAATPLMAETPRMAEAPQVATATQIPTAPQAPRTSTPPQQPPSLLPQLLFLLSEAAGIGGMVTGQCLDLRAKGESVRAAEEPLQTSLLEEQLNSTLALHEFKTGAMIRVSVEAVSVIGNAVGLTSDIFQWRAFGALVGLAFQIKDDLLDSTEEKLEKGSLPHLIGIDGTRKYLSSVTEQAISILEKQGMESDVLKKLLLFNQNRTL